MKQIKVWLNGLTHTGNAFYDAYALATLDVILWVLKWAVVIAFIAFNWYATFVWGLA
jgi:hypothetical protein